ncbi:MAG: glycosyltransferase family 4 protein [Hyphomicrobium sp.]|nr:MAG: glycosyltransferase family 4 protein [Hyphomicrobium sp.]
MLQTVTEPAARAGAMKSAFNSERRLVINGRFAGRPVTGVERFAREIVMAIDALIAERHPLAEGLRACLAVPKGTTVGFPLTEIQTVEVGRASGYAWEQIELPLFARGNVVLNLCSLAPILGARNVTCVHDAHIWLVPHNYSRVFRIAYRVLQPLSIRLSQRWVTVSQCSSDELVACGAADRPSDAITYNGADHASQWSPEQSRLDAAKLPARYVFALGSRSPNKNMGLIYTLADRLAPMGIGVIIAGGSNSRIFGQAEDNLSANVIHVGRVSDDDLALLFRGAQCFLFPSLHEGFGLPAVEAMHLGCAVVASNAPAMPEVLGEAAVLCDPHNTEAWVAAVERLCCDADWRQKLIELGRARAATYAWRTSALKLLPLLSDVAAGR